MLRVFMVLPLLFASTLVAAKPRIVATLPSLAALARDVGGDLVEVDALAAPTEDPHYVDPRPNLIIKLNKADLLIVNGLELEIGWLPPLQVAARNSTIQVGGQGYLSADTLVQRLEVPQMRIDRSMGDVHAGGNPHFLFDPRAAASIARGIGEKLATLDGANAATYRAKAKAVADHLEAFGKAQTERFARLAAEQRKVVAYHRSFPYLFQWLGLVQVTTVEPRPGISPDPGHVAQVLTTMRGEHVHVIVQEEYQPTSTSKTLAELAAGRVVTLPGGARFAQGQSYEAHARELAEKIYDAVAH